MGKLFRLLMGEPVTATFKVVVDDDRGILDLEQLVRGGWKTVLGDRNLEEIDVRWIYIPENRFPSLSDWM